MSEDAQHGLPATVRAAWSVLDRRTKRQLRVVMTISVMSAGLDLVALLMVMPLGQLALRPNDPTIRVPVIDQLVSGDERGIVLAIVVAALFLVRGLIAVALAWRTLTIVARVQVSTTNQLLAAYMRAPWTFHLARNSSELLRTITSSVELAVGGVLLPGLTMPVELATLVAVVAALAIVDPISALTAGAFFGAAAWLYVNGLRSMLRRTGFEMQAEHARVIQIVLQSLNGAKELTVRGRQDFFVDQHRSAVQRVARAGRRVSFAGQMIRYYLEGVLIVGTSVIALVAGMRGDLADALGVMAITLAGGFRLLPALNRLMFSVNQIRNNTAAVHLVTHDLDTVAQASTSSDGRPATFQSSLRFERVSFRYPATTRDALTDVDLEIRPGESVGIVGATGAGKSTLVDLTLGLLEPTSGRLVLDGADLTTCTSSWQRMIGYVPQDIYIADETLRANLAFGWADDEVHAGRIDAAVRAAQLGDVVAGLPDGLDTFLGERGVRLSGGQRQRVGIARALYVAPAVLVFDEATSALDNETERRLTATLDALHGRVTMIVVAHRLSTVQACDRIVVMDEGRISAIGTFDELLAGSPLFARQVGALAGRDEHA